MDTFTGYLKLVKDPKMEKISIQNLILRESTIKTSLWVYGLVIYTGMESKVMKSFKEGFKSKNSFSITTETKIFLLCLIINAILSIIFASIYIATGVRYQSNIIIYSYHFVMFSIMLPHFIFVARDLYLILLKITKGIT